MSWCRWGSRCTNTIVGDYEHALNAACEDCPGSSLYIYEGGDGIICMDCRWGRAIAGLEGEHFLVRDDSPGPVDASPSASLEMYWHVLAHEACGDHVRRSLVHVARVAVFAASG